MGSNRLLLVAAIVLAAASVANSRPMVNEMTTTAAISANSTSAAATPTVYQMLQKYGFPPGILPLGVRSYALHPDGSFQIPLPGGGCDVAVAGYTLRYGGTVSGNVQMDSIGGLGGVSVKVAVAWVGIGDVDRAGDQLQFKAGAITQSFPVSDFAASPSCQ